MPRKLRAQLAEDPEYKKCLLEPFMECKGRITWQHALMYGNRQIQERFAILPLCWRHHLGDLHDGKRDRLLAMARASEVDKKKYSRLKWTPLK